MDETNRHGIPRRGADRKAEEAQISELDALRRLNTNLRARLAVLEGENQALSRALDLAALARVREREDAVAGAGSSLDRGAQSG